MAGFGLHDATRLVAALDVPERFQSAEIMMFGQSLGENHRAGAGQQGDGWE